MLRELQTHDTGAPGKLRKRVAGLAALGCLALSGCFQASPSAVRVGVSQLAPYTNPAKAPDCNMQVLRTEPTARYTKVAIVEGWASQGQADALLGELRRKACETGADALIIVGATEQITGPHLYGVTPNAASEETAGAGEPGHYLHQQEHVPTIGEAGHSGYYMDAFAIVYVRDSR